MAAASRDSHRFPLMMGLAGQRAFYTLSVQIKMGGDVFLCEEKVLNERF
jgi:hypothetical protein